MTDTASSASAAPSLARDFVTLTKPRIISLLLVTTPYSEEAVNGIRSVPGRRWDGLRKVNTVPATSRADLWNYLIRYFNGEAAIGPRGPFTGGARAGV